jgi:pyruvate/2-oxoglutarate dehydrogenase complex dihydrolipoamide dehydrogenase (E3) component
VEDRSYRTGTRGGTCVFEGVQPSKTMITSARVAYLAKRVADYGVHTEPVTVDMVKVRERKRNMVTALVVLQKGNAIILHYRISGEGHVWPHVTFNVPGGTAVSSLSASALIWSFFQQHPLPGTFR